MNATTEQETAWLRENLRRFYRRNPGTNISQRDMRWRRTTQMRISSPAAVAEAELKRRRRLARNMVVQR